MFLFRHSLQANNSPHKQDSSPTSFRLTQSYIRILLPHSLNQALILRFGRESSGSGNLLFPGLQEIVFPDQNSDYQVKNFQKKNCTHKIIVRRLFKIKIIQQTSFSLHRFWEQLSYSHLQGESHYSSFGKALPQSLGAIFVSLSLHPQLWNLRIVSGDNGDLCQYLQMLSEGSQKVVAHVK